MASAFPNLSSSLGALDEDQQKQNIFGADAKPGEVAMQSTGAQPGGEIQKGTDEAGAAPGAGGGGGVAAMQSTASAEQASTQGDRAAIAAAKGKVKNPALYDKTKAQISSQDQALQSEADEYVNKAKATNYGVDTAEIEKGLSGDAAALSKVKGTLGKKAADRIGDFTSATDTTLADVDRFQTDEGIKDILRREGGEDYSSGLASFDLRALKNTPGFANLAKSLSEERNALRTKADTYKTSKTEEANKLAQGNLDSAKGSIRSYLDQQNQALRAANQSEADNINAVRVGNEDEYRNEHVRQAMANLKASNPDVGDYLDSTLLGVNPNDYFKSAGSMNWRDMVDDNEAARFERLLSSLGSDETVLKGRGNAGPSFDLTGYQSAALNAASSKKAAAAAAAQKQAEETAALAAQVPDVPAQQGGWGNIGGKLFDNAIGRPMDAMGTSAMANILGGPVLRTTNELDKKINPIAPIIDEGVDRNLGGGTAGKIAKKIGLGGRKK